MDHPLVAESRIRIHRGAARVRGLPSCPHLRSVVPGEPTHADLSRQIRPAVTGDSFYRDPAIHPGRFPGWGSRLYRAESPPTWADIKYSRYANNSWPAIGSAKR